MLSVIFLKLTDICTGIYLHLTSKNKKLLNERRFKYGRINENTGIASLWAETIRDAERGSGGNIGISQRGRPITDDRLLGTSSERYSSGNNERIRQTHETKEEIDEIVKKLREMYGLDTQLSLSKADDIVFIMSENKKRCIA